MAPVAPDTPCGVVLERLDASPSLKPIPVVAGGRPIGLVAREGFLAGYDSGRAEAPVTDLMDHAPLIVDVSESIAAVHGRIVSEHASALSNGFIVVEDAAYVGVCSPLDLLRATAGELTSHASALDRARREADRASRAKSQFLANMSHELRTPLNAIIGFSEIIRDQTFGPVGSPQYREYARDIHVSGAHLLDLVNDILDLSKVEAGAIELYDELLDIADMIDSSLMLVRQIADRGGVELAVDLARTLPAVNGDARKIKQVLVNLLSNAVKFTPEGGEVRIAVAVGEQLAISVVDTGIGMAPDEIPLALTPFKRIDGELNRSVQGTGLGLPLSKALVEAHGGTLTLASARGRGTTVTVTLPPHRLLWAGDTAIEQAG